MVCEKSAGNAIGPPELSGEAKRMTRIKMRMTMREVSMSHLEYLDGVVVVVM